ncbi:MAG TPA: DUF2336 domain-containing protein [Alphaproteobacteria bacterium]|nr:DUF2336 domain-containing protein [Alphaproteobacteria bacterium]
MSNGQVEGDAAATRRLLELAQDRARRSRRIVADNVADLFLSDEGRLSEHERALIGGILNRLLTDVEMRLRRDFAAWLGRVEERPAAIIDLLGDETRELARSVLVRAPMLRDPDLIEILKRRSQEHLLAAALKRPLPAEVVEAIADRGDENVVEQLLKGPDQALSRRALEYLVAESQRVDKFQQPVLSPYDLPLELARSLFWWVAAALRHVILQSNDVDSGLIDDCVDESTRAAIDDSAEPSIDRKAARLVESLADAQELGERFLVQSLRGGKVILFLAGLSRVCRLEMRTVRRIVFDPGYELLAIACRAVGFERSTFAGIHVLSRQGAGGAGPVASMREAAKFFDTASPVRARAVLRYWRADAEYLDAVAAFGGGPRP